ncbi:hypothetical protein AVEN_128831-1 [Araneus ventricosus]|uniref:Uncharacterized protein n=1 Tax=Araneus ventricosus TaxID=182803 RepID=A0A4Y2IFX0_ARAVE|nr:hypothetical protein AVEN_128831-1 [Araneus ventricosus]
MGTAQLVGTPPTAVHKYEPRATRGLPSNTPRKQGCEGKGSGGLVLSSRPWGRRAPGSEPDSTEDPSCMGPVAR